MLAASRLTRPCGRNTDVQAELKSSRVAARDRSCLPLAFARAGAGQLLRCQILWEMRNTIYKENGYCFHTQRAIEAFGNAGCLHDDAAKVPLNKAEKHNVSAIKQAEHAKGCA